MAKSLSFQRSISGLLTLALTLGIAGPGVWVMNAPRASAASYTVGNVNDSGAGSLRQAILDANANPGSDSITFSVNGTVNLLSDLPAITEAVTIDGSSQNPAFIIGAAGRTYGLAVTAGGGTVIKGINIQQASDCIKISNTAVNTTVGDVVANGGVGLNGCSNAGININGVNQVVVHNTYIGSNAGNGTGIIVTGNASNITIGGTSTADRNVIQNSTNAGIALSNCSNVSIKANYIGLDKNGAAAGNGQPGISVGANCAGTVIGGSTTGERNVIGGNGQQGIDVNSDNTTIAGNYIGTDPTGANARANTQAGIRLRSSNNTIGGNSANERNVISGNTAAGIRIDGSVANANNNNIKSNFIGTKADGVSALANASGIFLSGGTMTGNTIGGSQSTLNVIGGNIGVGIQNSGATNLTITGNFIGLGQDGSTPVGNGDAGIYLASGSANVGTTACASCVNIIDANTTNGIRVESNSNQIMNNLFGYNSQGQLVSGLANNGTAIMIQSTAASNVIGGTAANAGNTINIKTGQKGITSNGGNFNSFRGNTYSPLGNGGVYADRQGSSNENIATPTITSAIRISSNSVTLTGTAPANSTLDIYTEDNNGGKINSTLTVDGTGTFSTTITTTANLVSAFATNGSSSTSASTALVNVSNDTTAPTAPTLDYSSTGTPGTTVSIKGSGTEANAIVYVNGISTGVTVTADGSFSVDETLLEGSNTFNFTVVDGMSNTSETSTASIIASNPATSNGAGTSIAAGAAGSGGNKNHNNQTTETPINTSNIDTTPESMAGDTEVTTPVDTTVETPVDTTVKTPVGTTEGTKNTNATPQQNNNTPVKQNPEPVKVKTNSFYSGIYQFIPPIKTVSIRDTMPVKPALKPGFPNAVFGTKPFKDSKIVNGVPQKLLDIKLKPGADPMKDDDNDGLLNSEEVLYGSDPYVKDGDGDGVDDFQEVEFDGTNPNSWDSDHDLTPDNKDENPLVYDDPLDNVNSATLTNYIGENTITTPLGVTDSDNDGLCDELELEIGTNPQDDDSDADGLTDGDEVTHLGTDPNNATATGAAGVLRVTNAADGETVAAGDQFFMGSADAGSTVGIYSVNGDGTMSLLGQNEADENGRYTIYTDAPLEAGTYNLVAIQGDENNIEDISPNFTVTVLEWVKRPEYVSLGLKNNASITDKQPVIDLLTASHYMVVISWRSTIYSQVLIADSDEQIIYAQPSEPLENGEHTVTWYAQDLSSNNKSAPTRVNFNIVNEAFVGGQSNENSPWTLIFGSIAVLASLTALGLYFRRGKVKAS